MGALLYCRPLLHGGLQARFSAINMSLSFTQSKEQVLGLKGCAGF